VGKRDKKACGGFEIYFHLFLTSAVYGCEWSASRPGRLTAAENAFVYRMNRRLLEPRNRSGHFGEEVHL
jgi:hypothetical protein